MNDLSVTPGSVNRHFFLLPRNLSQPMSAYLAEKIVQKICGQTSQKFAKILQIEFLVNQAEIESI